MTDSSALTEKSPNIPSDVEITGRKRSHDEFSDMVKLGNEHEAKRPSSASIASQNNPLPAPVQAIVNEPSPNTSPALTEGGHTATSNSSPPTPSKSTSSPTDVQDTSKPITATATASTATPAAAPKKRKLTTAEREARDKELEQKKKEREEKQRILNEEREEKKKQKEEEKKIKEEEREEKRKKKEEDDKIKAQKVQEKENKKREAQEAKEKKERSQMKLNGFLKGPSTPKKAPGIATKESSPEKIAPGTDSSDVKYREYRRKFKPFYVKDNTKWTEGPTTMDDETRTVKSNILDEFMDGKRTHDLRLSRDPVSLFTLPGTPPPRGKLHHPVRHIMENVYRAEPSTEKDTRKAAREKLAKVPMKVIAFSQDVRPPYYGTITFKPFALGKEHMRKLAKLPTGKHLPLDYDYDSEAEWQEEEGEDLDAEDDEEEPEDEDDMDGFLDDADDAGPARVFANAMEPDSTGICFVGDGGESNMVILHHKMEIIMDNFDRNMGLDPWSSTYWEPEPKSVSSKPVPSDTGASKMPPPAAPANAFAALNGAPAVKLVKPEIINNVKQAIVDNKNLSKVGIVAVLYTQFRDHASRNEVKNTLEHVAEKAGQGRASEWALRPGQEIV